MRSSLNTLFGKIIPGKKPYRTCLFISNCLYNHTAQESFPEQEGRTNLIGTISFSSLFRFFFCFFFFFFLCTVCDWCSSLLLPEGVPSAPLPLSPSSSSARQQHDCTMCNINFFFNKSMLDICYTFYTVKGT